MNRHLSIRQKGFTLIELLIVIAVIGIIASMLIPNLIDAMQKTKQKRTMGDIHTTGLAMMSWLTDAAAAAAAGASATSVDLSNYGSTMSVDDLETVLVPQYVQYVPRLDGWKTPYDYFLRVDNPHAAQVMAIHSYGRDKVSDGTKYTVSSFDPTDYDRDMVWADGYMVRWPQK
jgi:prepilin-type N-terminal cleavage/methylation domain-containing protein